MIGRAWADPSSRC